MCFDIEFGPSFLKSSRTTCAFGYAFGMFSDHLAFGFGSAFFHLPLSNPKLRKNASSEAGGAGGFGFEKNACASDDIF